MESTNAVAVYCGSSIGTEKAFSHAATSLGHAIADANRPLVYGGGSKGIMGVVSGAVLERGGKVTGVVPYAMVAAGGEGEKTSSKVEVNIDEAGREKIEHVVVDSMHVRKVEMARRSAGFVGLPGGFGTFEEVLEVTTWTQLGIHNKRECPVLRWSLLNVYSFFEPLRALIENGISYGFIKPASKALIVFAALKALDGWERNPGDALFDWEARMEGRRSEPLQST
ncbi:hypothetical protein C8R46DRAFT_1158696 [Mycena filopes]|nr:hypothetical protein C8R46DRAFT_1158696 [Mycena filopes]